jgi:hypothetical protein
MAMKMLVCCSKCSIRLSPMRVRSVCQGGLSSTGLVVFAHHGSASYKPGINFTLKGPPGRFCRARGRQVHVSETCLCYGYTGRGARKTPLQSAGTAFVADSSTGACHQPCGSHCVAHCPGLFLQGYPLSAEEAEASNKTEITSVILVYRVGPFHAQ